MTGILDRNQVESDALVDEGSEVEVRTHEALPSLRDESTERGIHSVFVLLATLHPVSLRCDNAVQT
jgi:hypothetical protein